MLWVWTGLLRPARRLRTAVVCAKCGAKGTVYAALGVTALFFADGRRVRRRVRFRELTDDALEIPGGTAAVVVVGVGVAGAGCTPSSAG